MVLFVEGGGGWLGDIDVLVVVGLYVLIFVS